MKNTAQSSNPLLPDAIKALFPPGLRLRLGYDLQGNYGDRDLRIQLHILEGTKNVLTVAFEEIVPESLWNYRGLPHVGKAHIQHKVSRQLELKASLLPDGETVCFELLLFGTVHLGSVTVALGHIMLRAA